MYIDILFRYYFEKDVVIDSSLKMLNSETEGEDKKVVFLILTH